MAIQSGDIKLMKSEVLLDTDNGGGRITANEVVDGASNNLFPDVSELDRVYGRIALRKAYPSVQVTNTDSYLGAHAIVLRGPEDPAVSLTLFSTKSWSDVRTDARNRVESYVTKGIKWPGQLLETQLTGQKAIQILQKPADPLPKVGQTLCLVAYESLATEYSQYVRVTKVESVTREFTTSANVKWTAVVVTCTIANKLLYDFVGPVASPYDDLKAIAVCRDTRVADAAVYYGIQKMVQAASAGDIRVVVDSIYSQLVPAAQSETALADLNAAGNMAPIVPVGSVLSRPLVISAAWPTTLYLGIGIKPGSFSINATGTPADDGTGNIVQNGSVIGSIDYVQGKFTITASVSGTLTVNFVAAASPIKVSESASIDVDASTRASLYTITLNPPPNPRALRVAFMAQGNWFELNDQGGTGTIGVLKGGDTSVGAGTINYVTGTVIVTLGALPDVGSSVMFFWSTPSQYFDRTANTIQAPRVLFNIDQGNDQTLIQNSVSITWPNPGGGNYVATANTMGVLAGDGTGYVRWVNGAYQVELTPNVVAAVGTVFTLDYQYGLKKKKTFAAPSRDGTGKLSLPLDDINILPNSVRVRWNVVIADYETISNVPAAMQYISVDPYIDARDDGNGVLGRPQANGSLIAVTGGAVNYSTGVIGFNPDTIVSVPQPVYQSELMGYAKSANSGFLDAATGSNDPVYRNTLTGLSYYDAAATFPVDLTGSVDVEYMVVGQTTATTRQTYALSNLTFDITRNFDEPIVPGSVLFTWGDKNYFDRSGYIYTDLDPATGAATQVGTIVYGTGVVSLTGWPAGGSNAVTMRALLTTVTGQPADWIVFRVPAAPVRPGSLQVRVVPLAGTPYSVTADSTGRLNIDGKCSGVIDYASGVVKMRFGAMVTAAGNENAIWYNAAAVTADGKIFQPLPVFADQLLFNAVAYTYLPLDASLLGLDPVRLPQDGRVPIYRQGDVAVVHHTARQAVTPASGLIVDVGRTRVAEIRVIDSTRPNPVVMDPSMYTTDLDAGKLTFGTVNTTGMVAPIYVENRIEDMALLSDVQITGQLTLMRQLTHDYPANETQVSSALIMGDLQARMSLNFTQTTWGNAWADAPVGGAPSSAYNFATYPLVLTDKSCLQERWALRFTDSQNFQVIGESVGQVATGAVSADCIPTNPSTGLPYFTLRATGWGGGWAAGNVLRFNTAAANFPIWMARTVLQSAASSQSDSFRLQIRGDVDA